MDSLILPDATDPARFRLVAGLDVTGCVVLASESPSTRCAALLDREGAEKLRDWLDAYLASERWA